MIAIASAALIAPRAEADPAQDKDAAATRTLVLEAAYATIEVDETVLARRVTLPYHWERRHPGFGGRARFEADFELAVNGTRIAREGNLDGPEGKNHGRTSRMLPIPEGLLREGSNRVQLSIRADSARFAGVSALVLGPDEAVWAAHGLGHALRTHLGPVALQWSLLVGALAFVLWWMPVPGSAAAAGAVRRDPLYLYAWAGEASLVVRLLFLSGDPPIPWWAWSGIGLAAVGARCGFGLLFALEVAGRLGGATRPFILGLPAIWAAVGFGCGAATAALGLQNLAGAFFAASSLAIVGFAPWYAWQARRSETIVQPLLAAVLCLNALATIWDWRGYFHGEDYALVSMSLVSTLLFGLGLVVVVLQRFRSASGLSAELAATLTRRIADREAELAASYRRLEAVAREQARAAERARVLRQMHDGVGAGLAAAIRQLRARDPSDGVITASLRDALDRLKLTVDVLYAESGDVVGLLAGLRHRLEQRLSDVGLELRWQIEALPELRWMDDRAMQTLQSMLLETVSNVMQHADARRLLVAAGTVNDELRVRIRDDGRGFDSTRIKPRSLHAHARALGARLTIASGPTGTTVEIALPLEAW